MEQASILVVEDEAIVALELKRILERRDYSVCGPAFTGEEAVATALRERPDLILMDIHLGKPLEGIEAAKRIRDEAGIPVLFLTAYADADTLERAKEAAPYGYLLKPFQENEMVATLEMALHRIQSDRKLAKASQDLREAHDELTAQKRFLEALFQGIPIGVFVVDSGFAVRAVNAYSESALGIRVKEAIDRSWGQAFGCPEADRTPCGSPEPSSCAFCGIRSAILRTFAGEQVHRLRASLPPGTGGRANPMDFLITTSLARVRDEDVCIVLLEDVTELTSLREQVRKERSFAGIVGKDPKMVTLFQTIRELAESSVPVLIHGESGTGKELVASAIHNEGPRARHRFVAMNCGALPENLLESELFGHVRGSFTGAIRDKKGRFELASGGTLFLDEVAELSPLTQVKLLRVLQDGTFEPVGSERTHKVDVRIISATHKDLKREVAEGRFRSDLYYRLCVVPLYIPALRERPSDIPMLVYHFLAKVAGRPAVELREVDPAALSLLMDHLWPGNVRELENVLHYAFIKARGGTILPEHLPPSVTRKPERPIRDLIRRPPLDEERVIRTIREFRGNKVRAAKMLGVSRSTLYRFMDSQIRKMDLQADS
jgi:sigma-54 dependent transcriptional regulator, acetoin dehydrogenase operon transcriptional activator AcoR